MKFDISYTFDAIPRLLEGAFITIQVAILGFTLSVLLATTITIARTSLQSKILNFIIWNGFNHMRMKALNHMLTGCQKKSMEKILFL